MISTAQASVDGSVACVSAQLPVPVTDIRAPYGVGAIDCSPQVHACSARVTYSNHPAGRWHVRSLALDTTVVVPGGLTSSPMRSPSHPLLSVAKPLVAGASHHVKDMTFVRAGRSAGVVAFCPCGLGRRLGRSKLSSHFSARPAPLRSTTQLDPTSRSFTAAASSSPSSIRRPQVDQMMSTRSGRRHMPRGSARCVPTTLVPP